MKEACDHKSIIRQKVCMTAGKKRVYLFESQLLSLRHIRYNLLAWMMAFVDVRYPYYQERARAQIRDYICVKPW